MPSVTSAFEIRNGRVEIGRIELGKNEKPAATLTLAKQLSPFETPFYFYNLDHVRARAELMKQALVKIAGLPAAIHYAAKANANPKLLRTLKTCGLEVDVVSAGEADCAIKNGFEAKDVLFSGVAKTVKELKHAIKLGVKQINVESLGELERIEQIVLEMRPSKPVSIGLRLNPNVSPETHPYITTGLKENKFGLEEDGVTEAIDRLAKTKAALNFRGLSLHIGSQLLELSAMSEALDIGIAFQRKLKEKLAGTSHAVDRFDAGGGIGINYDSIEEKTECEVMHDYAALLKKSLSGELAAGRTKELLVEPGRWLVARSGLLVTEVQYVKSNQYKSFVIVDGGMNLLIRPALYEAEHRITPLVARTETAASGVKKNVDIVGPICESADFLGRERDLRDIEQGDRLVVFDAGAYGRTMTSNYNQRGWPAEYVYLNGQIERSDSV